MSKLKSTNTEGTSPRATYQDVMDAPPHKVAQIIDGKLYTHSRPAPPHALVYPGLAASIVAPFHYGRDGPGGWWILFEPELHFGEDVVVPDIAGWRRARMPVMPKVAYFTLAPDWVCEVLSPSTRKLDLGGKLAVYARAGVAYHWFVDPDERSLAAYQRVGTEWLLIDEVYEDATVSLPPFEAIEFDLGDLWLPHTVHQDLPSQASVASQSVPVESLK